MQCNENYITVLFFSAGDRRFVSAARIFAAIVARVARHARINKSHSGEGEREDGEEKRTEPRRCHAVCREGTACLAGPARETRRPYERARGQGSLTADNAAVSPAVEGLSVRLRPGCAIRRCSLGPRSCPALRLSSLLVCVTHVGTSPAESQDVPDSAGASVPSRAAFAASPAPRRPVPRLTFYYG